MAEEIKKIIIPISSLPDPAFIRYRIISEDRNQVSHWSPIYLFEIEEG